MIIQIKVRTDAGKFAYRDAIPGEFTQVAIEECLKFGEGWQWFLFWLMRVCLDRAKDNVNQPAIADLWYGRYKALREIQ